MLFYQFGNYEGFKELFGIQEHGNGSKSRRNKILLSYIKDPKWIKMSHSKEGYVRRLAERQANINSMSDLWSALRHRIINECNLGSTFIRIMDIDLWSNQYHLDDYRGVCEDGDVGAIRYVRNDNGRVFKKKAGRFMHDILMESDFGKTLPEPVMKWFLEEFTQRWMTSVSSKVTNNTLHIGNTMQDFSDIYDSCRCVGNFGSCMVDEGYHPFYKNAVKARAAWLENEDGDIVARCIIYDDVELVNDPNNRKIRVAERQYSSECDDLLKRILVDKLIAAGEIDAYKKVGADCHSPMSFVWNNGEPCHENMRIKCYLDFGDELSYQDSFKWYDMDGRYAYNFDKRGAHYELDTTEGALEGGHWDSWHDEYVDEDVVTVYYHGREYTCSEDMLDDFVWIEGEDAYYHTDDITYCDDIDDYVLEENAYWSDVTEMYYADEDNKERDEREWYEDHGWRYAEWEDKWYEDGEEVVTLRRKGGYDTTISKFVMGNCFPEVEYDEEEDVYVEL